MKNKNKMALKAWAVLSPGDTVDIVAPGFGITDERLKQAVDFVRNIGLKPRVPSNIFGRDLLCSNTDEMRLKHLVRAFQAKDSKAIWCLRGGYGALRIIEKFSKIKKPKENKLFIGYSDTTTIHNYLNQFWSFASVHGPLLDRLGQHTLPQEDVGELIKFLFGQNQAISFGNLKPLNSRAQQNKNIKGVVVGGNLSVTQSQLGTKFFAPPYKQIVFFEDIGERGYRVDKMLKQLEMSGYFKDVLAVVFGDFTGGEELDGKNLVPPVLHRFAQSMKIPIFSGVEAGHGQKQRLVPFGYPAVLRGGVRGSLTIQQLVKG